MSTASTHKYTNHTAVAGVTFVLAVRGPIVLVAGSVPARARH